jgi:NitT/TauT family transport system substrate-binding protein
MDRVRLCENMRAFGYAPFYFALAGGHFAAAGIDIELITSPSASRTGNMLLDGAADVSWGGPMRVMMHHQVDDACPLVCFAQIVARDPFVLVGRAPNPRFRFQDLIDLRIGVATEVPTPWLMLQDDLARAGMDPGSLRRIDDRSMDESTAALLASEVDVVQVFEPYVDRLTQAGCHVWHRFSDRGDIAYTTFYAMRSYTTAQRESCRRLVIGMAAALRAFHAVSAEAIADAIRRYFPEYDVAVLSRIVAAYRDAGLWPRTPALPVTAFVRLKGALLSGGLIDRDFPFERIVDPELSHAEPA